MSGNGAWQKFKDAILVGLDINIALLATSIVLVPYSILASFVFGGLTVSGFAGAGFAAIVAMVSLGILSIIIQLAALGWVWKWLNRKGWLASKKINW